MPKITDRVTNAGRRDQPRVEVNIEVEGHDGIEALGWLNCIGNRVQDELDRLDDEDPDGGDT